MGTGRPLASLAFVLALGLIAWPDIIVMRNGREFESDSSGV